MTDSGRSASAAIAARAGCRVDLAGGTLDIWPLGLLHEGSRTINVAITLSASVRIAARRDGYGFRLDGEVLEFSALEPVRADDRTALAGEILHHYRMPPCVLELGSDSPRGAGLGGSSALAIALIAAIERFFGNETEPSRRAGLACDLEARLMRLPTGRQDHYPALLGGALEVLYRPGGEQVRRLNVDLDELGRRLIVVYSGKSHFSAGNNWQVVRRRLDGEAESQALFDGIAAAASEVPAALEDGDWARLGRLMSEEWSHRRRLADGISTPLLEQLLTSAENAGAWGGKACGAGGGGCVAVVGPAERRHEIETALAAAGGELLPAAPRTRGVEVTEAKG